MNKIKHVTALIALSLASSSFAQATDAPATIFEHTKFAGKSQALVEGMNVGPLALGNDSASSVKVSKCFKVTLYGAGPGQNGPELVLTADNADLTNDNFNDILSNVLVERVPNCSDAGHAAHEPSDGAKGTAGAEGTFEFKPKDWKQGTTSWWKDSDGVAPGVAGCHIGTDSEGNPNGRMFGEACRPDGLLVESNPGASTLHKHDDDTGHPDTYDCHAWCIGEGYSGGSCTAAAAPPCESSAICACD